MTMVARVLRSASAHTGLMVFMTLCFAATVRGIGEEKASYVGGTLKDFPNGGFAKHIQGSARDQIRPIEGSLNVDSTSELTFDAGRDGRLVIAYHEMSSLSFGLAPQGIPKGGLFLISWDPLDQYSKNAHYLLSVLYRDQAGIEQGVVFELGKKVLKPTLEKLETRSGLPMQFSEYAACQAYKGEDGCGSGTPRELRGLRKVFVDAGADGEYRTLILAELEKAHLDFELLPTPEGAQIVLRFRGEKFNRPNYVQTLHGGRGEVNAIQDSRPLTIVAFSGTRLRAFGDKPATKFAAAFIEAYRVGNR
jgi:hypothetical protein